MSHSTLYSRCRVGGIVVSTAFSQNSIPGLTTELSGWAINVYSFLQQMEESNIAAKGKMRKLDLYYVLIEISFIL